MFVFSFIALNLAEGNRILNRIFIAALKRLPSQGRSIIDEGKNLEQAIQLPDNSKGELVVARVVARTGRFGLVGS